MAIWNVPPKAKIYEALSAIADGRVNIIGDTKAEVVSSSGNKTYLIEWSDDFSKITSNDNASYWQGYLGYPILAVLLTLDRLQYSKEIASHLAGVYWKKINTKYKNDWDKAVGAVLESLREKGSDIESINAEVDNIMEQVNNLSLEKLPSRQTPPKGN